MEPDKQRRGAREDGVALGDAWWVYADLPKKEGFATCNKLLPSATLRPIWASATA